ncbi:MAG: hypothetical protein JSU59_06085 [Nitrospirota bacterium]|nr:MAG: hypothetical protein JSU59_06085 [Nitrospirota bacterium]
MRELNQKRPVVSFRRKFLRFVLQFFIGGMIFLSALGKSLDMPGFIEVLKAYQAFPPAALKSLAFCVTGIEFFLGFWILSGYRLSLSAWGAALLNTLYTGWMVITLLRGLAISNCGCFGVFFPQPLTWLTPIGDLVLVGMCVLLAYLTQTEEYPNRRLRTALLN